MVVPVQNLVCPICEQTMGVIANSHPHEAGYRDNNKITPIVHREIFP